MSDNLSAWLVDADTGKRLVNVPGGWNEIRRELLASGVVTVNSVRYWVEGPPELIDSAEGVVGAEIPVRRRTLPEPGRE